MRVVTHGVAKAIASSFVISNTNELPSLLSVKRSTVCNASVWGMPVMVEM